ncbi:sugar ABC transporter permease [Clostridia bacterium]|nr:sugar ABC transporter permease [Clostridia bacterium]
MVESRSRGDRTFVAINTTVLVLLTLLTLYPCLYVLFASVSDPVKLYAGSRLLLAPRGFSVAAYSIIMSHAMLWRSYLNTLIYVSLATVISLAVTIMGSYVLSRQRLPGRGVILTMVTVTMFFGGGLIPTYLVVVNLHLIDTIWAMVLPSVISTYNLIMMLTYFRGIPAEMEESAHIDGANDWTILTRIMVPLALPVIAVIALYVIVSNWNSYVPGTIYLRTREKYPLQVILREILISGSSNLDTAMSGYDNFAAYSEAVKYATIIVTTVPVLMLYPFLQRFFIKGVMLGAVKG